jgi:hypothetical protein
VNDLLGAASSVTTIAGATLTFTGAAPSLLGSFVFNNMNVLIGDGSNAFDLQSATFSLRKCRARLAVRSLRFAGRALTDRVLCWVCWVCWCRGHYGLPFQSFGDDRRQRVGGSQQLCSAPIHGFRHLHGMLLLLLAAGLLLDVCERRCRWVAVVECRFRLVPVSRSIRL